MINIITVYNKLFKKLHKLNTNAHGDNSGDNEISHILQDKIYRKFIKDIINNKFSNDELKTVAKNMHKYVVKHDVGRWYA